MYKFPKEIEIKKKIEEENSFFTLEQEGLCINRIIQNLANKTLGYVQMQEIICKAYQEICPDISYSSLINKITSLSLLLIKHVAITPK